MPKKRTPFSEAAGNRLRTLRIAMGFETLRSFANELGVGEDRYDKWEKGKALVPPEIVGRLKLVYGITADWLYYGDEATLSRQVYADLRKVA